MSRSTEIADLLRQASRSTNLHEQQDLVRQAEELKSQQHEARFAAASEWSAEDAVIRDTLVPGRVHELHTASTDWIMDLDTSFDAKTASNEMVAEASLWFGRVSDDVKSYGDEYTEQARGLARRLAGKYGDGLEVAERAFLDEAQRLRAQAVRAGIITEANLDSEENSEDASDADGDPMTATASSTVPQVGDSGYPDQSAFPATNGNLPPDATSSNRAPALQELANPHPSQDVVPANDPGLANQAGFPVSGSTKESSVCASCPTCGGRSRARRAQASLPEITDITKMAASGLDQIDQIADAKDNPSAPGIPYPVDVAFPWTLNPAAQVAAQIPKAEQQVAERNSRSPLATTSGRDNSGWIGDMGAKGLDYPGEQAPTGDASDSLQYQDPVYGHGGDQGDQQILPYGHAETSDRTNQPDAWAPGQPSQADNGWREAVANDPHLASAIAYVEQRRQAHLRSGR